MRGTSTRQSSWGRGIRQCPGQWTLESHLKTCPQLRCQLGKPGRLCRSGGTCVSQFLIFFDAFCEAIAGSLLDDGDATTAVATAAGGWAGGLAGSGVAAAAASSLGIEALGAGSMAGGLVVCGSLSAMGVAWP